MARRRYENEKSLKEAHSLTRSHSRGRDRFWPMTYRHKLVNDYIRELRDSRNGKPQQIQEALDIYIELWERVIEKKIVDPNEDMDSALSKLEASGGLYQAAQEG